MAEENTKGGESDIEFEATLVHGQIYYLGNKVFERGKAVPVTNAEKAQLEDEEHAGDVMFHTSGGETDIHVRLKFAFAPVGSGKVQKDSAARAERTAAGEGPPRRVRQARAS